MWISLILVGLIGWAPLAYAAIDCTADGNATVQEDPTPADPDNYPTYSAPSGSNTITLIGASWRQGVDKSMTVTVGGLATTAATTEQYTNPIGAQMWYRLGVAAGSADVSVDWDGAPLSSAHGVVTCTGVDQVSPIRDAASATGTSTTPSVTVSGCQSGDVLVDFVAKNASGALTVGSNQTEIDQVAAPSEMNAAMSWQNASDGNVMDWSMSSTQWSAHAVCLAPASTADLGGDPLWLQ